MGFSFKKVFSNPTKTLGDVFTGGTTALLRETKIAPKLANNITRVGVGTLSGAGAGFLSAGPYGAIVGGASGFGYGVNAAAKGQDINLKIATDSAKYGALTAGTFGLARGVLLPQSVNGFNYGVSGQVGKAIASLAGISGVKGATGITAPKVATSGGSKLLETLGIGSLVSNFLNKGGASALLPGSTTGPDAAPANGPINYPSINPASLYSTSASDTPRAQAKDAIIVPENKNNWLWLVLVALVGLFLYARYKAKKGHH